MKISIIVPTYNQEKYLGRCLRSLINQNYDQAEYQIIVVNDGSNDRTGFILELFQKPNDSLIKVINNEHNKGLPYSINKGLKNATTDYIVRVDSDDYVNENFLLILSLYLDLNDKAHAVSCDYILVDDKEKVISRENSKESPIACGIMFRKQSMIDVGMYDEDFLLNEEKDFKIRFEKEKNIDYLSFPLYRYRRHKNNMTNNAKEMDKYEKKLMQKHNLV